jgi:hypothetical protein
VTRLTTAQSGAYPLYANRRASGGGTESLESRYFKPFRGIMLLMPLRQHCIKFDVLIDLCVGSGHFNAYAVDVITICFNPRRQLFDLFPRTGILSRQGSVHRKVKCI